MLTGQKRCREVFSTRQILPNGEICSVVAEVSFVFIRYMIYPDRDKEKATAFLGSMRRVAPGLGVNLAEPRHISMQGNRSGDYMTQLAKLIPTGPEMIFCVVPNDKGDQYAAIKKKCCIEQPVPSQVVTVSKVLNKEKGYMSMATKVVTQMACKMGAEPWALEIPFKGAMVIG